MADAKALSRETDRESQLNHDLSSAGVRSLLGAFAEAIVLVDVDGRLITFNAAAQHLFGEDLATNLGRRWSLGNLYEVDQKTPVPPVRSPLRQAYL